MINVVFDTNVLVAALLKPDGLNSQAMGRVFHNLGGFGIVLSSQITDEYRDVLFRPEIGFRGLVEERELLLELIADTAQEVVPVSLGYLRYPDVKDKPFLEAAVYTDAILITNNIRDFPFLGVRIMRPGEFLEAAKMFGW